jgi:hypothetical protein
MSRLRSGDGSLVFPSGSASPVSGEARFNLPSGSAVLFAAKLSFSSNCNIKDLSLIYLYSFIGVSLYAFALSKAITPPGPPM